MDLESKIDVLGKKIDWIASALKIMLEEKVKKGIER